MSYLRKYPDADRTKLVRTVESETVINFAHGSWIFQLHEASLGLVYLHQRHIVHGDLKGVSQPA